MPFSPDLTNLPSDFQAWYPATWLASGLWAMMRRTFGWAVAVKARHGSQELLQLFAPPSFQCRSKSIDLPVYEVSRFICLHACLPKDVSA